jgi:hypothetical protein
MSTLPRPLFRTGLAACAALAAVGLASCSGAGLAPPAQGIQPVATAGGPTATSTAPGATPTPSAAGSSAAASVAPSSIAAPSTSAARTGAAASSRPASTPAARATSTPVPSATVKAKGDAAKDTPAGWPQSYRVPTKAEDKGVGAAITAQKKAVQVPAAVAQEIAEPSNTAKPTPPDFGASVEGAALSELQGDYVEAAQNGWVTTGTPVLKGDPRVVDLSATEVRVFACIDYSAVQMTDAAGNVLQAATPAGTRARLQIYDMTKKNGSYVITAHQVAAEDPEC